MKTAGKPLRGYFQDRDDDQDVRFERRANEQNVVLLVIPSDGKGVGAGRRIQRAYVLRIFPEETGDEPVVMIRVMSPSSNFKQVTEESHLCQTRNFLARL